MLTAILLLTIQTLHAQPDRFGLPACNLPGQELATRTGYVVCHDGKRKVAAWTAHELTPEHLHAVTSGRQHFRQDRTFPSAATDADYRNSGFHRSHLVPASDLAWSPQAVSESYLLSNAVPQLPELNRSAWRRIENDIRNLAAGSDALFVLTGTLFDCAAELLSIGAGQVAVPCATYKIALAIRGEVRSAYAVILANHPAATRQTVSIREVERRSGLDFFSHLPSAQQDYLQTSTSPLPNPTSARQSE